MQCNRCHRKLKDTKSIDRGYGPICFKKNIEEDAMDEFNKNQLTIDEALEFAKKDQAERINILVMFTGWDQAILKNMTDQEIAKVYSERVINR